MRIILYHYPLSPFSRKVRIFLAEKQIDFEMKQENFWLRRRKFLAMNPAAQVPVLIEEDDSGAHNLFSDSNAICEYLDEKYNHIKLIGETLSEKAEIRRLTGWFNNKFYYEVTKYILDERVFKFLRNQGEPSSVCLQAAKNNIHDHMEYITFLLGQRRWLAGEKYTMADVTAASQLSVLDYLSEVPWDKYPDVKNWYMIVKSRPSFRPLLDDMVAGFNPPQNYANLDF